MSGKCFVRILFVFSVQDLLSVAQPTGFHAAAVKQFSLPYAQSLFRGEKIFIITMLERTTAPSGPLVPKISRIRGKVFALFVDFWGHLMPPSLTQTNRTSRYLIPEMEKNGRVIVPSVPMKKAT